VAIASTSCSDSSAKSRSPCASSARPRQRNLQHLIADLAHQRGGADGFIKPAESRHDIGLAPTERRATLLGMIAGRFRKFQSTRAR